MYNVNMFCALFFSMYDFVLGKDKLDLCYKSDSEYIIDDYDAVKLHPYFLQYYE